MGLYSKENVGESFEIELENTIIIYKITDESFDHEFGTEYRYGHEIESVQIYCSDFNDWVDITDSFELNAAFSKFVNHEIETHCP